MRERQRSLFDQGTEPWLADERRDFSVARVVFAENPFGPYDYRIGESLRGVVEAGMRVDVPLGRGNSLREGYCIEVVPAERLDRAVESRRLKEVARAVDERPLIDAKLLDMARWMAERWIAPLGQVLETIVPGSVRSMAGTREVAIIAPTEKGRLLLAQPNAKLPDKQRRLLETAIAAAEPLPAAELAARAGCTIGPIRTLLAKELLCQRLERRATNDWEIVASNEEPARTPNDEQRTAIERILASLESRRSETLLLHGVTGSGKTEVYMQAIRRVIRMGRQAIVLVPEISLTPQTRSRFRSRFSRVAVLHSHLSPAERHAHWKRIAAGDVDVIVGARSAVFAPAPRLGLIVIDEEHDGSFKQDKTPRYHARDVAEYRVRSLGIPLILGTATPSLESWRRAEIGEIVRIPMLARVLDLPLPDVALVDLRTEFRSRSTKGMISRPLQMRMKQTLADDGQVILMLNRRGFATSIQCPACGFVVTCPYCDLALTHHRDGNKAICHYCDFEIPEPKVCPDCRFDGIRFQGFGTQKLEEEVALKFPDVPALRMDSDTMRKLGSHESALERFRSGEVRILLGTQMIAKGLDFPNVMLVGVINADTSLHFPDFRAAERTFALVTQVAGRTGRGSRGGTVVVQTFSPEHPALQAARHHDYATFAAQELPQREQLRYPPCGSLARFVVRSESESDAEAFADRLAADLRARIAADLKEGSPLFRVVGPAECPIPKLRNHYRFHLLLQGLQRQELQPLIRSVTESIVVPESVQWIVDVDPLDLL
ncbi:MAG TPA: primosomal protein N' [Pirellulaceae bacterium]|nr:primosomal protein N' [Pirellulaceae bacterium]